MPKSNLKVPVLFAKEKGSWYGFTLSATQLVAQSSEGFNIALGGPRLITFWIQCFI